MTSNNSFGAVVKRNIKRLIVMLGLFGTLFSIWTFFQAREVKSVTYLSRFPSKVFDSDTSTAIRVTNARGEPIKNDIHLQEVVLWNSGNQVLDIADVRRPLEIALVGDPLVEILEYRVASQTQDGLPQFCLQRAHCCNNKLRISWKYFDPDDGARFHIIYLTTNERPLEVALGGTLLGVGSLTDGTKSRSENLIPWLPGWLTSWLISMSWFGLVLLLVVVLTTLLDEWRASGILKGCIMVLAIGASCYFTIRFIDYLLLIRSPPF